MFYYPKLKNAYLVDIMSLSTQIFMFFPPLLFLSLLLLVFHYLHNSMALYLLSICYISSLVLLFFTYILSFFPTER